MDAEEMIREIAMGILDYFGYLAITYTGETRLLRCIRPPKNRARHFSALSLN
jgi:hypothetical protein